MIFARDRGIDTQDITIQVTGNCNLNCDYCFYTNKNCQMLDIDKAKVFIDKLISNDQSFWRGYFNSEKCNNYINLQFVGGEPFVNYKAIITLINYFEESCRRNNKVDMWNKLVFGAFTNGTIYNKEIEDFILKYRDKMNLQISIDGIKPQHDMLRKFIDGKSSYDVVVDNLQRFRQIMHPDIPVNVHMTITPATLKYTFESVVNLFENLKFKTCPFSLVFEDVWCLNDAKEWYQQLKKVADWMLESGLQWDDGQYHSLSSKCARCGQFNSKIYNGQVRWDIVMNCGGNGRMLFLQYDGKIYNCSRYSEIAIGDKTKDLSLGDVEHGIVNNDNVKLLRSITKFNISPPECIRCPVANGCNDCLALNYKVSGNFTKSKTLCDMHKAQSLANVYFWNKYYLKNNIDDCFLMYLSPNEALKYVDEKEVEMLLELSNRRFIQKIKEANKE